MKKIILFLALVLSLAACEKQKLQKQFENDCKTLTENYWIDKDSNAMVFVTIANQDWKLLGHYYSMYNETGFNFESPFQSYYGNTSKYKLLLSDKDGYTFKIDYFNHTDNYGQIINDDQYGKIENNNLILNDKFGTKLYYIIENQEFIDWINSYIDFEQSENYYQYQ